MSPARLSYLQSGALAAIYPLNNAGRLRSVWTTKLALSEWPKTTRWYTVRYFCLHPRDQFFGEILLELNRSRARRHVAIAIGVGSATTIISGIRSAPSPGIGPGPRRGRCGCCHREGTAPGTRNSFVRMIRRDIIARRSSRITAEGITKVSPTAICLTRRLRQPATGQESRRDDCGNKRIAEADARTAEVRGNECRVHSS